MNNTNFFCKDSPKKESFRSVSGQAVQAVSAPLIQASQRARNAMSLPPPPPPRHAASRPSRSRNQLEHPGAVPHPVRVPRPKPPVGQTTANSTVVALSAPTETWGDPQGRAHGGKSAGSLRISGAMPRLPWRQGCPINIAVIPL